LRHPLTLRTTKTRSPAGCCSTSAIELLRGSERPVVIAGSGAWWADCAAELQQFVELTSLPLFTIGMARGLVRDDHELCFGYADPALNRACHKSFQEADCSSSWASGLISVSAWEALV
jgi:thiamine pyrophosphate-dependent acetolactate synthase large subunit-like protein